MPEQYGQVYMLQPDDPLFTEIGNKFIAKQAAEWGTDHVYNCDTYNEMEPSNSSTVFLQASARAVLAAMTGADSAAVWLMQGWLFHEGFWKPPQMEAYLTAVRKRDPFLFNA
jgi:alpha-N-acetylglucosaminidase